MTSNSYDPTLIEPENGHLRYLLTAYLFESISEAGKKEVEEHLAGCAECRAELEELRGTLGLLRESLRPKELSSGEKSPPGYSFEARRLERVLTRAKKGPIHPIWNRRVMFSLAAAALVGVTLRLMWSTSQLSSRGDGHGVDFLGGSELSYSLRSPGSSNAAPHLEERTVGGEYRSIITSVEKERARETAGVNDSRGTTALGATGVEATKSSPPTNILLFGLNPGTPPPAGVPLSAPEAAEAAPAESAPQLPAVVSAGATPAAPPASAAPAPVLAEALKQESEGFGKRRYKVNIAGFDNVLKKDQDLFGETRANKELAVVPSEPQSNAALGTRAAARTGVQTDKDLESSYIRRSGRSMPPLKAAGNEIVRDETLDDSKEQKMLKDAPAESRPAAGGLAAEWKTEKSEGLERGRAAETGLAFIPAKNAPAAPPVEAPQQGLALGATPRFDDKAPPTTDLMKVRKDAGATTNLGVEPRYRAAEKELAASLDGEVRLGEKESLDSAKVPAQPDGLVRDLTRKVDAPKVLNERGFMAFDKSKLDLVSGLLAQRHRALVKSSPENKALAGADGIFDTPDDRVLISGRGVDGIDYGGESSTPTDSITLKPKGPPAEADTKLGRLSRQSQADPQKPENSQVDYFYEDVAGKKLTQQAQTDLHASLSDLAVTNFARGETSQLEAPQFGWALQNGPGSGGIGAGGFGGNQTARRRVAVSESKLRSWSYYKALDPQLEPQNFFLRVLPVPEPVPGDEGLGQEEFRKQYGVHPFVETSQDRHSTFGMDVDTASYSLTRGLVNSGKLPDPKTVRVEEWINSFREELPAAEGAGGASPPPVFTVKAEGGPSPYGSGLELLKVTVKARELLPDERKNAVLTFAIDASGSMGLEARLSLVKEALHTLVNSLRDDDRVGIVAFGAHAWLALPHTPARERERIHGAIDSLSPTGGTNVEAGLDLAYRLADEQFEKRSVNRVILASDGVANVGAKGPEEILGKVKVFAGRGVYLSAVGFGGGKYNDELLETLAKRGNGNYAYVDSPAKARELFETNLPSTLQVLAADAKVQVEFDPQTVARYRLLGYEKRDIADKDFRNDKIDAGEVGPGSTVTVLYEIQRNPHGSSDLAHVRLRYRDTGTGRVEETDYPVPPGVLSPTLEETTDRFRFIASVAEEAELLRGSYWARSGSHESVLQTLSTLSPDYQSLEEVKSFTDLVTKARNLTVRALLAK